MPSIARVAEVANTGGMQKQLIVNAKQTLKMGGGRPGGPPNTQPTAHRKKHQRYCTNIHPLAIVSSFSFLHTIVSSQAAKQY